MPQALESWHAIVASGDVRRLDDLIADDAVFHSPIVFTPQAGKAITVKYLTAALSVLGNDSFRYVAEWTAANSAVLEFHVEIDGILVDGADFITWTADGKISDFKVMIRPLKAIDIVLRKMGEELARLT